MIILGHAFARHARGAAPFAARGTVSFNKLPFSFKTRTWLKFENAEGG